MDMSPIWISLKTGIVSIIFTFFIGLLFAKWVMDRKSEFIKMIIDGIFTMPLVLPPTVAGFFLLCIFGNNSVIGKFFINIFGFKIAFSWAATVIAAVVISFPLMYKSARAALERTLGISETGIFINIMIPNAMEGIVSGTIIAFARGLGEFGATSMLAGNIMGKTRTLPLAVYSEVAAGNMDKAGVYVAIIVSVCFAAVFFMNIYRFYINEKRKN